MRVRAAAPEARRCGLIFRAALRRMTAHRSTSLLPQRLRLSPARLRNLLVIADASRSSHAPSTPGCERIGPRRCRVEGLLDGRTGLLEFVVVRSGGNTYRCADDARTASERIVDRTPVPVAQLFSPVRRHGDRIYRPAGELGERDHTQACDSRNLRDVGSEGNMVAALQCAQQSHEALGAAFLGSSAAGIAGSANRSD